MNRETWFERLDGVGHRLNVFALWLAGIALVLMAIHVSFDAFSKYLLRLPIPATLEIVAYYYMPAAVALPIAYVEAKNGHISVGMLFERLPRRLQTVLQALNDVVMMTFIGLLTWLAGREAIRKFDIGEYMFGEYPIIIWPGRFVFTAALALVVLISLIKLIRLVLGIQGPDLALKRPAGDKK